MAPETQEQQDGSTEDSSGQEQQDQQETTDDTSGNGSQQPAPVTKDTKLPDDHPLVKQLAADKAKLASVRTELAEARAQATKSTQLEQELAARPTQEALDTLQTRYDRLEEFTQAVGLGKALDSRTFTKELFETDKPIEDLVKDWNKAHPSTTSTALGSAAAQPAPGKINPNDLLRAAIKGSSN